ncbi:prolipoprotein diacylglyceryl transferase [Buchananella felis]|uniref:prolipoprotein diacylglyceryl transferase n=1 Tax=Buchananella felis TaxID=3231492 RepID=UPI003526EACD
MTVSLPLSIPSPSQGVWHLGPLPLRAYALFILVGIFLAVIWSSKRYAARGGDGEVVYDAAIWVVPAGILGGRLYYVFTVPEQYFGEHGSLLNIVKVWEGGLGIWGAVVGGGLGALAYFRYRGLRLAPFADALAPALIVAQAIGRLGNYFNQELFGRPTTLPWGLEIDAHNLPPGYAEGTLFHPTFLYELLWNLLIAAVLLWIERRRWLVPGQLFVLYVIGYTLGRSMIETLRIDKSEYILGIRVNLWLVFPTLLIAIGVYFYQRATARKAGVAGTLPAVAEGVKATSAQVSARKEARDEGHATGQEGYAPYPLGGQENADPAHIYLPGREPGTDEPSGKDAKN